MLKPSILRIIVKESQESPKDLTWKSSPTQLTSPTFIYLFLSLQFLPSFSFNAFRMYFGKIIFSPTSSRIFPKYLMLSEYSF